jgi:hypothetical protein
MHPNLSFEQAPPLSVPFRFVLTAPLFGVAAGLLLLVQGGDMLASRWTPGALAATHLMAVGFMLQAMCGALLQFVPVAAGGNIWRPRLVAGFVHPLLAAAAVLLAAAFLTQRPALFFAAALGFALALGAYILVVGIALSRRDARGTTITALRIALAGLLVTLLLGVTLATGVARGSDFPFLTLTSIHAAWGLGGWALILLAGVSYYVVPMFQLTPAYPIWLARGVPWMLLAVLLLWSAQLVGFPDGVRVALLLGGFGVAGLFAAATLYLQSRRRRKLSDTTLLFFRTAMLCLLVTLLSVLLFALQPALWEDPRAAVWLGVLLLVGVFASAISGMLYKVVPFLIWLHLQRLCGPNTLPPTMNLMIPARAMRRHFHTHIGALIILLLASVGWPSLARAAGLAFALDCAWLGLNLVAAVRVFFAFRNRIRAGV